MRHKHLKTLGLASLFGLLLLNATATQAALIKVESFWGTTNANFFLETTAFIESSSFTGIGAETISLTSFDLLFIDIRPQNPNTFLTAELSPTDQIFINFLNGNVQTYTSTQTGTQGVGLDPGNTFLVFNPSLARLTRVFPLVGQTNYGLQPNSVITSPVPLPAAGFLFLSGFVGLIGLQLGKRNLK